MSQNLGIMRTKEAEAGRLVAVIAGFMIATVIAVGVWVWMFGVVTLM